MFGRLANWIFTNTCLLYWDIVMDNGLADKSVADEQTYGDSKERMEELYERDEYTKKRN